MDKIFSEWKYKWKEWVTMTEMWTIQTLIDLTENWYSGDKNAKDNCNRGEGGWHGLKI